MSIHPTAIVNSKAEIDSSVEIGPYCVVDENVRISAGCRLWQNVYVTGWTEIGAGCELHPGVIVGHAPQDVKYAGERTFCRVGERTILREYATVHRGTIPESETRIGNDCFLLGASHVGHNCTVGDNVTMINQAMLAGHVELGNCVTLGGGAGIHQFVRIGELAMVRGLAAVAKDIIPFGLVDSEGRIRGLNRVGIRRAGIEGEELREIRTAFRLIYGRNTDATDAPGQIDELVKTRCGRVMLDFLKKTSKRGLAGRLGAR